MDGRLNTGYEENQYRVYIAVEEFENLLLYFSKKELI